jgi:predicted enzyme related to lactoylglutathione lyase
MTKGIQTVIYPVSVIASAKALYTALLGAEPSIDEPYYVGFTVNGQDIGLDPNGHAQGMAGPVAYVHVADIDSTRQALLDAGVEDVQPIREVGGGRRIATVKDPDGNVIGLLQDAQ